MHSKHASLFTPAVAACMLLIGARSARADFVITPIGGPTVFPIAVQGATADRTGLSATTLGTSDGFGVTGRIIVTPNANTPVGTRISVVTIIRQSYSIEGDDPLDLSLGARIAGDFDAPVRSHPTASNGTSVLELNVFPSVRASSGGMNPFSDPAGNGFNFSRRTRRISSMGLTLDQRLEFSFTVTDPTKTYTLNLTDGGSVSRLFINR